MRRIPTHGNSCRGGYRGGRHVRKRRPIEFSVASGLAGENTAGESNPNAILRSLISIELHRTATQTLVDTGAKLSCISEEMLQCNDLLKHTKIRKSDRRAYGVNGEPVVTLGIVDLEFKIGKLVLTHQFTILRGLIHPILLGLNFLTRYRAKIDLGGEPSL